MLAGQSKKTGNTAVQSTQPVAAKTVITGKVKASDGLKIRSEANSTASILTVVPYQETVSIIDTTGPGETISGQKANWIKIEYKGTAGWAWGGFVGRQ